MMKNKVLYIFILIILCLVSTFSQVLLKKASQHKYDTFLKQYMNPYVFLGYSLFVVVVAVNIFLLRFIPIAIQSSISESMPLVLSFITGKLFFAESITKSKIIGGIFVIVGIFVILI